MHSQEHTLNPHVQALQLLEKHLAFIYVLFIQILAIVIRCHGDIFCSFLF